MSAAVKKQQNALRAIFGAACIPAAVPRIRINCHFFKLTHIRLFSLHN